jgi:hypothetical protein
MERTFNLDDFSVRFKFDLDRPYDGIKAFWEPRIPNEVEMQHLLPLYMDVRTKYVVSLIVQHPSVIDGLTSNWSAT